MAEVARSFVLVLVALVLGAANVTSLAGPVAAAPPNLIGDEPTDGSVQAIAVGTNGSTYLAGTFSTIGAATGYGAGLGLADGAVNRAFPSVNGHVYASAPDGSGGFFIGGVFNWVGGVARINAAHVLADGSVDPFWLPNPDAAVRAIAVSGSTIFLGGDFSRVGGLVRWRAAAVEASGVVTGWNPAICSYAEVARCDDNFWPYGSIRTLVVVDSVVYLGGQFKYVAHDQARSNLAAVTTTDGAPLAWAPDPDNAVHALALSDDGSALFVGGDFSSIGAAVAQGRTRLAAVNTSDGVVMAWAPTSTGRVETLAVVGQDVFAGGLGLFSSGDTSRDYLAKIDSSGAVAAWDAQADGAVRSLEVSGRTLFVGGDFSSLVGAPRARVASLTTDSTAMVNTWNPGGVDAAVRSLAVSGSTVYVGGDFRHVNLRARTRAAGLDAAGVLTAWNPAPNGDVRDLAASGATVYLAGVFSEVGGQSRSHLGAVDATTGLATTWNPGVNNAVNTLAVSGSTVYLGGTFSEVGGQGRGLAAAVDASGSVTAWDPALCLDEGSCLRNGDGSVEDLVLMGSTVFLGGQFGLVNSTVPRSNLAAVSVLDGTANGWAPNPNSTVNDIAVHGSQVFAAGSFNAIGGQSRSRLGAVNTSDGTATAWSPQLSASSINALAVSGSTVFVGGAGLTQTEAGGGDGVAAANMTDGAMVAGAPRVDPYHASVEVLAVSGIGSSAKLLVGGDFARGLGGWLVRPSFGQFGVVAASLPPAPTNAIVNSGKASWSPRLLSRLRFYLVSYRPVGQSRWGLYALRGQNNGLVLNNPGDAGVCSAENRSLGFTDCPMPYGWVSGTTYEFAVAARAEDNRNSPGPQTAQFTFTAP